MGENSANVLCALREVSGALALMLTKLHERSPSKTDDGDTHMRRAIFMANDLEIQLVRCIKLVEDKRL